MTACSKYQTSTEVTYSSNGKSVGLFTTMLLEGCGYNQLYDTFYSTMYADNNGDNDLTLHEAYTYANEGALYVGNQIGVYQNAQVYPVNSSFVIWGK